jgi:hypothetical protein
MKDVDVRRPHDPAENLRMSTPQFRCAPRTSLNLVVK